MHHASARFWACYRTLPQNIQKLADEAYARLKYDIHYPGVHFEKIEDGLYSGRVGLHYRALAIDVDDGYLWVWIGTHEEYNKLV